MLPVGLIHGLAMFGEGSLRWDEMVFPFIFWGSRGGLGVAEKKNTSLSKINRRGVYVDLAAFRFLISDVPCRCKKKSI